MEKYNIFLPLEASKELFKPYVFNKFLSDFECRSLSLNSEEKDSELHYPGLSIPYLIETNTIIFDKILSVCRDLNKNTYKFNISSLENVILNTYTAQTKNLWNIDMAFSPEASTRKLTILINLSLPGTYQGGEIFCQISPKPLDSRPGNLVIFPSYMAYRITPVRSGNMILLKTWLHGHHFR